MKLFDGQNTLTAERKDEQFIVYLTGTQVNQHELEFLKSKTKLEASEDDDYAFQISYLLSPQAKSLKTLMFEMKSELDRLELILQIKKLFVQNSGYKIPFVHPENIFFDDGQFNFIHMGIKEGIVPMAFNQELFLSQYKGIVLSILNPKLSYDHFVNGELSLKDKFSRSLASCESFEAIQQLVELKRLKEKQKEATSLVKVSKGRYQFFKYAGSVAVVAAIAMGVLTVVDQKTTIPKQKAIMAAQADFITNHYDKTLDDLKAYQPKQLSKDARFVLASSSINLANLSQTQKAAVLNNISSTTDDNTLNYWIYQGRGEFEKALNLAKNIGDDQLTLLAYTDLYQATKMNTSMNGDEKQKKLEEYNKQIQELSKSLGK